MKELKIVGPDGVLIENRRVDVKGQDIEIVYSTPIYCPVVAISLTEVKSPECTEKQPCCDRRDEYNGFGSDGALIFTCPKHCPCHD